MDKGFVAGCGGGISGTALDLAFDAAALYGEGGVSAACATAEASTISYNVCKTVGRVAGAAFSCTPTGKGAQLGMGAVSTGLNVAKASQPSGKCCC